MPGLFDPFVKKINIWLIENKHLLNKKNYQPVTTRFLFNTLFVSEDELGIQIFAILELNVGLFLSLITAMSLPEVLN